MITKKQVCTLNYHFDTFNDKQILALRDHFSIARLAESSNFFIRSRVAINKQLPLSYALKLAKDGNYNVRGELARFSTCKQVLKVLLDDSKAIVSAEAKMSLWQLEL